MALQSCLCEGAPPTCCRDSAWFDFFLSFTLLLLSPASPSVLVSPAAREPSPKQTTWAPQHCPHQSHPWCHHHVSRVAARALPACGPAGAVAGALPASCWAFLLKLLRSVVLEENDPVPAAGARGRGGGAHPTPFVQWQQPLLSSALPGASSRTGERRKGKAWETELALCVHTKRYCSVAQRCSLVGQAVLPEQPRAAHRPKGSCMWGLCLN